MLKVSEIMEMIEMLEGIKPVVTAGAKMLVELGPDLHSVVEPLRRSVVEAHISSFNQYMAADFSREEALLLTINSKSSMEESLSNMKINKT